MLQPNLALTTIFPDRWLTSHTQHNSCLPLSFKLQHRPSSSPMCNPSIQTVPMCSHPLAIQQPLRQSVCVFPHLSSVYSFCSCLFFLICLFHLHSRHSTNVLTVKGLPLFHEPLTLLLCYINQLISSSLCIRLLWQSESIILLATQHILICFPLRQMDPPRDCTDQDRRNQNIIISHLPLETLGIIFELLMAACWGSGDDKPMGHRGAALSRREWTSMSLSSWTLS